MSIDPRTQVVDKQGWQPCIPPVLLGRVMDRICEGRKLSLLASIAAQLETLRRRMAR
jgi:hypothetical protein